MAVMRPWIVAGVVALACGMAFGGSPATAAAGAEVLAVETGYTTVSAYDGRVVWSRFDPRRRRFRLVELVEGRIRVLPVRSRKGPFDVDLGPGPNGRVWAVYSRCASEVGGREGTDYERGRRCAIHAFDFGARRERRLPGTASRGAVYRPSVWRQRLAFVRHVNNKTRMIATGDGRRRVLPNGPGRGPGTGPSALDLRGSRLVIEWGTIVERCPGSDFINKAGEPLSAILIDDLEEGTRRTLQQDCGPGPSADTPTLLAANRILYVWYEPAREPGRFLRTADLGSGGFTDAPAPPFGVILSLSSDGSDTYTTLQVQGPTKSYEVRRESGPT